MSLTKISRRDALSGGDRSISVQHSMVHEGLLFHRSVVVGPVGNGSTYWVGMEQTNVNKRIHLKSAQFWLVGHYFSIDLYENVTWAGGGSSYPGFCRNRQDPTVATMIPKIGVVGSGGTAIMQLNRGGTTAVGQLVGSSVAAWHSEWIFDAAIPKYAWKVINSTGASNRLAFELDWYELDA